MKLNVRLNSADLKRAASQIRAYRQNLDEKCQRLSRMVAELIAEEASTRFAGAVVDDLVQGSPRMADVSVRIENSGNICVVIAEGNDAVFAEFGAGVYHNGSIGSSPHPRGSALGMTIGSYGKGNGRKTAWGFVDETGLHITHGAPASMPLYTSMLHVSERIEELAREVFAS